MSLNMLLPPPPDFGYVHDQAVDHYFTHRHDAVRAVELIPEAHRRPYVALDDTRMFAALAVGMLDAERAGRGRLRAPHSLITEVGQLGVLANSVLELQAHVVGDMLVGRTVDDRRGPFLTTVGKALLGEPWDDAALQTPKERATVAGAELLSARLDLVNNDHHAAQMASVVDPLHAAIESQFDPDSTPDSLLRVAQRLGAGCIELSALVAQFVDPEGDYKTVRQIARSFGAGGMVLRQLTTVRHDLRVGMPTFATEALVRAEHIGWKEWRALSAWANAAAHDSFYRASQLCVNDAQRGVFRTLRTEMQAKFQLNRLGWGPERRPITPAALRAAQAAGPFKAPA